MRTFEPQIVPKHTRRVQGFDEAIISRIVQAALKPVLEPNLETGSGRSPSGSGPLDGLN